MFDHLETGDRPAEGNAVLGVLHRVFERGLSPRHLAAGGDQALALELPHQVRPALAFLAQPELDRNPAVLEEELRGVR